jgi:hypothetical protein
MSDPGFIFGQVPTAAQWNNAFDQKQDVLNYTPVNRAGDSMTGKLVTTASIAGTAGFAISPGVVPSVPTNGDVWLTNTGMFARVNGSSVQLATTGSGVVNGGTVQQLAYYASSGNAVSGNSNLTVFNGALTLGVSASIAGTLILSGLASGGVTLASASAGGSGTITLPAGTIDFSSTGGASQVVKQTSAGGIFTVSTLAISDITAGATGQVLAGAPAAFTRTPTLGSSGSVGSLTFGNATSGLITIQPVGGALGTATLSLPAAVDTLTGRATTDTLTNKTFDTANNTFKINGSGVITPANFQTALSFTQIGYKLVGVNFNSANTDNPITITLPTGVTRYAIAAIKINNASASIGTATAGVFTAVGGTSGAGIAISSIQAITITATTPDTNNNTMTLTINNSTTQAYNDTTLYFRIGVAQGSPATADVILIIFPLT